MFITCIGILAGPGPKFTIAFLVVVVIFGSGWRIDCERFCDSYQLEKCDRKVYCSPMQLTICGTSYIVCTGQSTDGRLSACLTGLMEGGRMATEPEGASGKLWDAERNCGPEFETLTGSKETRAAVKGGSLERQSPESYKISLPLKFIVSYLQYISIDKYA